MMLRLLQINLGRGIQAQDLLRQTVAEKKADLVIISEPHRRLETVYWFQDTSGKACNLDGKPKARRVKVLASIQRIRVCGSRENTLL